jgi:hypothetical protein
MTPQVGYCTNVHAGAGLAQTRANLERYALAVKWAVSPDAPIGVGLWLSAAAARQMRQEGLEREWAEWLADVGLVPFTFNGFPHGDFHQKVVKHDVYLPTWADAERLRYTLDLIHVQHALLPAAMEGSISTLPIVWGTPTPTPELLRAAAVNLRRAAEEMAQLESRTGRLVYLCLEPEPGCALQRSEDVVGCFEGYLLPGGDERAIRRHLRVCHDVCHQVVMFEEQADVFERYRRAGIGVGKVQVSSAVCLDLNRTRPEDRAAALAQLAGFNETRYLHQTVVRPRPDATPVFYEDLPLALRDAGAAGEWRVHFHVPVYLERFGLLETSRSAIVECLRAAAGVTRHWEVETYAWGVLPPELRQDDLASGIAEEMRWFQGAQPVA